MSQKFPVSNISRHRVISGRKGPSLALTDYDLLATSNYVPRLWIFRETLDLDRLRSSLEKTLALMPVFAGTLIPLGDGRFAIECDDRGAELVVQDCSTSLPENLPEVGAQMARALVTVGVPIGIARNRAPLLIITYTRLRGGGTALGMAATHLLCDGGSASVFFRTWAQIAKTDHAPDPPTLDRASMDRLAEPYDGLERGGASTFTEHGTPSYFLRGGWVVLQGKRARRRILRYSPEEVGRFKSLATGASDENLHLSRYDILIAHLWRELAAARGGEHPCELSFLLDLRQRRELEIASDLIGNAFLSRELAAEPARLREDALVDLARTYRARTREPIEREAVGKDLAWLREARKRGRRVMARFPFVPLDGGVMINQRTRMGELELDFGAGRPIWFENLAPFARMAMILPTPALDGGCMVLLQTPPGEGERVRRMPVELDDSAQNQSA